MPRAEKVNEKITAVLVINRSDSLCTYCGRGCFPEEDYHYTLAGYKDHGKPGCGAKFVAVSTNYHGLEESVTEMRPDLPFISWKERVSNVNKYT